MATVNLKPSEIRFSQDSISNKFSGAIQNRYIGDVLDRIYNGDTTLLENKILANMKVGRWDKPGCDQLWFTVNNRSLWVLKELELLGKINGQIQIHIDPHGIDAKRFTTKNKGTKVIVRQRPVGGTRAQPAEFWAYKQTPVIGATQYGAGMFAPATQYGAGVLAPATQYGAGVLAPATQYGAVGTMFGAVAALFGGGGLYVEEDDGYDSDEYYI